MPKNWNLGARAGLNSDPPQSLRELATDSLQIAQYGFCGTSVDCNARRQMSLPPSTERDAKSRANDPGGVARCRVAPYIAEFHVHSESRERWRALPSKIVFSKSPTGSNWFCSLPSARAKSPPVAR